MNYPNNIPIVDLFKLAVHIESNCTKRYWTMSRMDVNKYVYCTIKTETFNTVTQYIQHV